MPASAHADGSSTVELVVGARRIPVRARSRHRRSTPATDSASRDPVCQFMPRVVDPLAPVMSGRFGVRGLDGRTRSSKTVSGTAPLGPSRIGFEETVQHHGASDGSAADCQSVSTLQSITGDRFGCTSTTPVVIRNHRLSRSGIHRHVVVLQRPFSHVPYPLSGTTR